MSRMYEVSGCVRPVSEDEANRIERSLDWLAFDWQDGEASLYGGMQLSAGVGESTFAASLAASVYAVTGRFVDVYVALADAEDVYEDDDDEAELAWEGYVFGEADFVRLYAEWCAKELECHMNE